MIGKSNSCVSKNKSYNKLFGEILAQTKRIRLQHMSLFRTLNMVSFVDKATISSQNSRLVSHHMRRYCSWFVEKTDTQLKM